MLLGRAAGGADAVTITDFAGLFPAKCADLPAPIQSRMASPRAYDAAPREAMRLLGVLGQELDPWETLRTMARTAGIRDESLLWALITTARAAGLAPSEVNAEWAWPHDAALGIGAQRFAFRRALTAFDQLFEVDEIVARGLLPTRRLGPPPVYDSLGAPAHATSTNAYRRR
jgi:hypothetical protein